jgi:sec-independent protein translocase protein TatC
MAPLPLLVTGSTSLRLGGLLLLLLGLGACLVVARKAGRAPPIAMPFLAHLDELRRRVVLSLAAWLAASTFAFSFGAGHVAGIPAPVPSLYDNLAAQVFRGLAAHLVPDDVELVVLRPMDAFMAEFAIALGLGAVFALPVLLLHLNAFVTPALRPAERRFLGRLLGPLVVLFLGGCAFALLVVLPFTLDALYGFAGSIGARPLLGVTTLAGFALGFCLAFGVAFQTPVVMVGLSRAGIVEPKTYVRYWRHSVVGIVIVSAFLTPDPTLVSQVMMAGPLVALYAIGCLWSAASVRKAALSSS